MGNHQNSWLRGRNAIVETLDAGRWLPLELVVSEQLADDIAGPLIETATVLQVPFEIVGHDRLTQLCNARDHQGVIARMPPFPYCDLETVVAQSTRPELFLILDSLQDPFNFGSVCRSAGVFGVDGMFVAESGQAEVSSQVARSSAGAINRLRIARVESLCNTVDQLKASGVRTIATSPRAEQRIDQLDCTVPLAVVIGNEGDGVSDELLERCDDLVAIPQATGFESLNAAVSAGIVLYEITRQRSRDQSGITSRFQRRLK
ncbi:MAG: 23S rRNA (guanosine(2251)-2'-O)-methyltransferase RlmB [Planctomycetota bacterium]|nr:23S rRNA (guanosine(2251)-2'-O)-methyltransferase RlmB [Planctomycetota bacterium]